MSRFLPQFTAEFVAIEPGSPKKGGCLFGVAEPHDRLLSHHQPSVVGSILRQLLATRFHSRNALAASTATTVTACQGLSILRDSLSIARPTALDSKIMFNSAGVLLLAIGFGAEPVDHLALAADALDRGEASRAITHLNVHMNAHPGEVMTRAYLAELLFREKRLTESAQEFEGVIAQAYRMTGKPHEHLVHCHTRLMGIAEESRDSYREYLHRGIGLWRLVKKWNSDDALSERTLIQARDALEAAKRTRSDARVNLYLAEVAIALKQPAAPCVMAAAACPPTGLNAAERTRLAELKLAN